jgi:hypothetical protein
MPIASHTKASNDHKTAANAHESAVAMHTKGDHTGALDASTKAKGCCDTASTSSADAHKKSAIGAKK